MDKQFLKRRRQTWYVRVRVPPSLHGELGPEVVRSLKTRDLAVARERRWPVVAAIKQEIAEHASGQPRPADPDWILEAAKIMRREEHDPETRQMLLGELLEQHLRTYRGQPLDDMGYPRDMPERTERTLQAAMRLGLDTDVYLFSACMEDYLSEAESAVTKQTLKQKRKRLEAFQEWAGDMELPTINKRLAGKYLTEVLMRQGRARKTIIDTLSDLGAFFSWAETRGLIESNPFHGLGKSVKESTRGTSTGVRQWTPEELHRFFSRVPVDDECWTLAALALYTGMRANEIGAVTVDDIHGDRIHIPESKTEAGVRDVPIHPVIAPLVKRLKETSTDGYLLSNLTPGGADKKRAHGIIKRFVRVRRAAGVADPRTPLKGLRKNLTNALEQAGVPVPTIQLIVGHKRRGVTFEHYSKDLPFKHKRAAMRKVTFGKRIDGLIARRIEGG